LEIEGATDKLKVIYWLELSKTKEQGCFATVNDVNSIFWVRL
jgi:hypothetical protein